MNLTLLRSAAVFALLSAPVLADKKKISPPAAPRPAGAAPAPLSPGILVDGTLYVSGQTGTNPANGQVADTIEGDVKQALENVGAVLKAGGMDYSDVVTVTIYLDDMDNFQKMNAVYTTYFKDPMPARTTVGVAKLAGKSHIEITVIARK